MRTTDKKKIADEFAAFIRWCEAKGKKPSHGKELQEYMRTEVRNGI